ncbi:hypothetical protein L2E82_12846 [Cichorium intybus]|uniref:Uncharacterized protein n=1 Tax=Cichorium intybus TaxID=13427 RepID=A0ACB9GH81_CICIN|nr:hypothetical protein L2E82_12846 [Cichorium intybus]
MDSKLNDDYSQFNRYVMSCNNITQKYMSHLWTAVYQSDRQNQYSKPLPWIGIYIALASLFCIVAMVADLLHGFHNRKLWFPCKYFTLNAASLTVIAVTIKLPMDLTNLMPGDVDRTAKLGSLSFMCTIMANLLPSLATMGSKELVSNMIALGILVITLVVNVCIEINSGVLSYLGDDDDFFHIMSELGALPVGYAGGQEFLAANYVGMLLMLLIIYACSSFAILKSKQILESKYQAAHQIALKDLELLQLGRLSVEKLKQHVSNYWIMAATGSPQFMTVCSATTSASGVICAYSTALHIYMMPYDLQGLRDYKTNYKWSMLVILVIQFFGVILGTIVPLSRCFVALSFKLSVKWIWNHIKVFKVESYWTQKLYDWKKRSIPFPLSSRNAKIWLKAMFSASDIVLVQNSEHSRKDKDLSRYVLQLQDDMEFAERTLKGISKSVNRLIQKAEKQPPKNLMKLLAESRGFEGVEKFDSQYVPSLISEEHHNCWSLPLVTLTAITISFSNIPKDIVDGLLSGMYEGLVYVTLVEESFNATDEHGSIQKVAKTLWLEVEVHHEWLGNKLPKLMNTAGQTLRWLRDTAKNIVTEVESMDIGVSNDNSTYRSISANSMYRITETLLLSYHDHVSQEELVVQLSSMIADIMAACLTNFPRVIAMKCHAREIEKREVSVLAAAKLLGETTQIINTIQDCELPNLNPDELAFIDKWHAYLKHRFP